MATATKDFDPPTVPDQAKAGAIVKKLNIAPANVVLKDQEDFDGSWAVIQRHDEALAAIGEMFDPFVDGLHKLHKMAVGLRAKFLDPVVASKKLWLRARITYSEAAAARKKKEDDEAAERIRKANAAVLVADAKKAEKRGDVETATVLREQAKTMPAPSMPSAPAVTRPAGSVVRGDWKFEIEKADDVPREFCDPTPAKIRKVVSALGDKIKIPGVRVWFEKSESTRAVRP